VNSELSAAAIALGLVLAGGPAAAFSSQPEVELTRAFSPASAMPGQQVTVRLTVHAGAIGADPLRGLIVSEHIPAGLDPSPGEVLLDGQPVAALTETVAEGLVEPGCVTWRWVLETPPDFNESLALPAGADLEIDYRVTIPAGTPPGTIAFPGAGWIGMIAAQAEAGDHYGYEDAPALLGVEAAGDDRDEDGLPDDWESEHGLDPDDPADAAQDADSDGFSNLEEFQAGTDPTDPDSHPALPNQPPEVIAAASPASGDAPLQVQLEATAGDPDGEIVAWTWDFGDGSSGQGAETVHTYTRAGSFVARVTVSDDRGATASDTVSLMIYEAAEPDPKLVIKGGCGCASAGAGGRAWAGLFVLLLAGRLGRRSRSGSRE